jgi:hypothetical protein
VGYVQASESQPGAAGIDETITIFEQKLSGNLYKLWNRMSSESYLPPVNQVAIRRHGNYKGSIN